MADEHTWNDESRESLRETLRWRILGELRMAKRGHDDILRTCREVYIEDDSPKPEWNQFIKFSTGEIERTAARLAAERAKWPEVTDCDRLDRVEVALRERGIILWQASPCCDTCTLGELADRIDGIDHRYPGFRGRIRGYAFFIDQNLPEHLADGTQVPLYLAYGWTSPGYSAVAADVYQKNAVGIGREVCECLQAEGFEPTWDGDLSRKIRVSLNWQRRTMLE